MKFIFVDDEKTATDLLESYIDQFARQHQIEIQTQAYHNPVKFLEQYCGNVDLVFMDIDMKGLNGLDTARELRRMDANVVLIFITNLSQFAIHGYEVEAIDYVLKPLTYADFSMKLQKALRYIQRNQEEKITITTKDGVVHSSISEIYYIEVSRHYLEYHTVRGNYTVRGVMKEVEEKLKACHFARCSQGYLVNLKYVQEIHGNTVIVAGKELSVSRGKKAEFLTKFAQYVGGM